MSNVLRPSLVRNACPEELASSDSSMQEISLQEDALDSILTPEASPQLDKKLSRGAYYRSRKSRTEITMAEDQNIWQGRLRPRRGVVGASQKPQGIIKQYGRKTSKNGQPAALVADMGEAI
jgi:hypothetical protein